jgi:hypothetical protein
LKPGQLINERSILYVRLECVGLAHGVLLAVNRICQTDLPHEVHDLPAVTEGVLVGLVCLPSIIIVQIPGNQIPLDGLRIGTASVLRNDASIASPSESFIGSQVFRPVVGYRVELIDLLSGTVEDVHPEIAVVDV